MLFEFLDASFSSLRYFVFEFYVHHFRTLRIFFEFKVSFVFEFSVLFIKRLHLFLATTNLVYSDDYALRRFVTVSGVVVSLRYFKSLLYLCRSSIARGHPTRTFKENTSSVPVFPYRFVPFEIYICVSCYKYRLIFSDALAEILTCRKF